MNRFEVTGVKTNFVDSNLSESPDRHAIFLERFGHQYKLISNDAWGFPDFFNKIRNEDSMFLRQGAREPQTFSVVVVVPGFYDIANVSNPVLTVRRGQKVTFDLNVTGHPFYLQTFGYGYRQSYVYSQGFSGNGETTGRFEWFVPEDAPDELFYQCEFHSQMFGKIIVVD